MLLIGVCFITDSICTCCDLFSSLSVLGKLSLLQPQKNGHSSILALYTDVRLLF